MNLDGNVVPGELAQRFIEEPPLARLVAGGGGGAAKNRSPVGSMPELGTLLQPEAANMHRSPAINISRQLFLERHTALFPGTASRHYLPL